MIRLAHRFCCVFMVCMFACPVLAQIPATINYQGRLETLDGVPYEGEVEIVAGLFESAEGGTALWGEIHAGVEVVNGVYSLMLGTGQPLSGLAYGLLSEVPFDRLYYLELTIDGETLDARQALSSVPYALNAPALEGLMVKNGKLGIGVENPTHPLEVEGMIDADWLDIRNVHIHGEEEYGYGLHLYTPTARMVITEDDNTPGWIRFRPWAGEGFMFSNNGDTPWLTIAESGHILAYASLRVNNELYVTASGQQGIGLTSPNASCKMYEDQNHPGWIQIRPNKGQGFFFSNNGDAARLTIREDGKIGIGTLNPTHELTVNGTIRTKGEVIVDPNGSWPDRVFDDSYELMPLEELAQYVQTHKHLPEVPSQAEIAEEGIEMGAMQATLLQKVEELTLHVIALQKNSNRLQQENERLKARLSALETTKTHENTRRKD